MLIIRATPVLSRRTIAQIVICQSTNFLTCITSSPTTRYESCDREHHSHLSERLCSSVSWERIRAQRICWEDLLRHSPSCLQIPPPQQRFDVARRLGIVVEHRRN